MSAQSPITFAVDADDVGWIVFDDPKARANVFNLENQIALGVGPRSRGCRRAQAWNCAAPLAPLAVTP